MKPAAAHETRQPVLSVALRTPQDVLLARQRTRQVAAVLGFDVYQQVRLATAASETARYAYRQARGGQVDFAVEHGQTAPTLVVIVTCGSGGGEPGSSAGLARASRLVEHFQVDSAPGQGTTVRLSQPLPRAGQPSAARELERLAAEEPASGDALLDELRQIHAELAQALEERDQARREMAALNQELEETNRGVVAIYAELDEKAEQLRIANQARSRFFASVSHEFRTPVNAILALTQLLLDRVDGELTPDQDKQVAFIRKAAHELGDLVNDLLDLAKAEAGQVTVRPEPVRVSKLFGALRGVFRPLVVNPDVVLLFDEPEGLPTLFTDEGKLAQVLRNYISNALKFTPQGEVRVSARLSADGQTVTFAVADTGIGIAREDQSVIFQEFGQVENPVQKRVKGSGLGLSLSKQLVELLGGSVGFESELGRGSTFYAYIPVIYPGGSQPDALAAAPEPARERAREVVLIVDDDEIARYLLRGYLAARPYDVREAASGEEGLRLAGEARPSVIFLDLNMPGMNDFEVLDRLQASPATRSIPVIIMTSHRLSDDVLRALAGRVVDVLSKEAGSREDTLAQINAALDRALGQR